LYMYKFTGVGSWTISNSVSIPCEMNFQDFSKG
jgi:hypothetical protein